MSCGGVHGGESILWLFITFGVAATRLIHVLLVTISMKSSEIYLFVVACLDKSRF